MTLADVPIALATTIRWIHAPGDTGERLMELGLVPGAPIRVVARHGASHPMQIEVRGFRLSLRLTEAAAIEVDA